MLSCALRHRLPQAHWKRLPPGVRSQEAGHRAEQVRAGGHSPLSAFWGVNCPGAQTGVRVAALCSAVCWRGEPWGHTACGSRQPGPAWAPQELPPRNMRGYLGQGDGDRNKVRGKL